MAGCGNSRMTEEMFEDGEFLYRLFFATDFFLPRRFQSILRSFCCRHGFN